MPMIVVALGGNALGSTAAEQHLKAEVAARSVADLVAAGHKVAVTHGNGPQVGNIKRAMDKGGQNLPLPECTAMSQGYIAYHLMQCLKNEFRLRKIEGEVCAILTQVLVDENDPAFGCPTKPIGSFYREEEARVLMAEEGHRYVEDAGRGWRRVVASPKPVDIIERAVIKQLVDAGVTTVACGGGGMPVVDRGGVLAGIDAVIDKDFAAARLAELIGADRLLILTAVDAIKINFNKPDEKTLRHITAEEAARYIAEKHFAPGSMLPKVEAALAFVQSGAGRKAIIGSLENAAAAIRGESGTVIS